MFKNFFLTICIFFLSYNLSAAAVELYIIATVNDEIITNHDVKKEGDYLKILNPNLVQLDNMKISKMAKTSLINEIIKKKEIKKFIDLDKENSFVDDYLKNFYIKLNFKSEKEFENILKQKENYSINEIKEKIKIELLWNELVFMKYGNQVKIDEDKLVQKINNSKDKVQKEYFLSEIIFKKKKNENLDTLKNQINLSINEIGFNNTANIYSISESSKIGGKLGWIKENNLSDLLIRKLSLLNEGQITDVIQIGNNYFILKIEKIKLNKIKIDKKVELEKMINFETNKQLNQFSRIYFSRSKMNYSINEN